MKHLKYLAVLCLLITISSCTSGPLTETDNNTTVEYQLDSPFQIQLEGDAQGKNKWVLQSEIEPVISLTDQNTKVENNKTIYTFNFKVNTDGEKNLVLSYQTEGLESKTFQVKVIAGTMGRILEE
ncbi:hypothetical protein [Bizionia arctica]|uniref:Proteinase inhibitor I42 chagasin domain-containing protein n=1 Tax=Bizionia arctica TaxID=1495645 RepID=A0A917GLW9_9FLAO|nr:hypothetical protein [Bizionia arctica]GGG50834.1 hypothetical protein GCM10010976_22500 [Bizionia arctica]